MKNLFQISIIVLLLAALPPSVGGQNDLISPVGLDITGDIKDNYVNMSYGFSFEGLSKDSTFSTTFTIPEGLYLSNMTVLTDDIVYYGQVKTLNDAQQDYQDAVESNQSSILIQSLGSNDFELEANIKSSSSLYVELLVEGFLLRYRSSYSLQFLEFSNIISIDLTIDLNLISTQAGFRNTILHGLGDTFVTSITNGINLEYSDPSGLLDEYTYIEYELDVEQTTRLIGYNNGDEQFFVYQLAPEIYTFEDQAPKNYVYIIDKSGSMGGNRIENAKSAFISILENLNEFDYFNVIKFDSNSEKLWENSLEASIDNINDALNWVETITAGGGTNFHDALQAGLQELDNEIKAAKAITILSDGDPSSGITDENEIKLMAETENIVDAPIFSISLGDGIDTALMQSLSYESRGSHVHIESPDELENELLNFYSDFSAPITTGMTIDFTNSYSVYPEFEGLTRPIYNGSEVLIVGKFDSTLESTTTLEFAAFDDSYSNSLTLENTSNSLNYLERIWAIYAIESLIEQNSVDDASSIDDEIIELALDYGLLVEGFTAMIVVVSEPSDFNALDDPTNSGSNPPPVNDVVDTIIGQATIDSTFFAITVLFISIVKYVKSKNNFKSTLRNR